MPTSKSKPVEPKAAVVEPVVDVSVVDANPEAITSAYEYIVSVGHDDASEAKTGPSPADVITAPALESQKRAEAKQAAAIAFQADVASRR